MLQRDLDMMVEMGFNAVRLFVSWQAAVPVRGSVNYTYLRWDAASSFVFLWRSLRLTRFAF